MGNHVLVGTGHRPGEQGWSSELIGNYHPERQKIALFHYPYRTLTQMSRKVRAGRAALEATNYSGGVGQHWRELGALDDDRLAEWWGEWTRPLPELVSA
jgi:hypothetical protein